MTLVIRMRDHAATNATRRAAASGPPFLALGFALSNLGRS